jgi:hypothetical protein
MGVKIFQTVNPVFAKQSTFFSYLHAVGWCITFVPRDIRNLRGMGKGILKRDRLFTPSDVTSTIERIKLIFDDEASQKQTLKQDSLNFFSIPFHDYELYSHNGWLGPFRIPEDVETFLSQLERLISFLETEPRIRTISLHEIPHLVLDAPASIGREELSHASLDLSEGPGKRPPQFVEVNRRYYSNAELYQALVESLAFYALQNELPEMVALRDIIGPTVLTGPLESIVTINGDQLLTTILYENFRLTDSVPSKVRIAGTEWTINPSEMLHLMAEAFLRIDNGKNMHSLKVVPSEVLPLGAEEVEHCCLTDGMQKAFSLRPLDKKLKEAYLLQLWTYKPMRLAA